MKIRLYLLSFVLGALLVGAFSPFDFWPLGILCPAGFFLLSQKKNVKPAWIGFLFGFGFFGFGVSWIFVSIATYGNTNLFVASAITLLFVLILSAFPALQAYLAFRFFRQSQWLQALLVFPSLWTLTELVRGSLFTGFPWLLLGYSQTFTALSGFAKCFSVFGVSWLTAFFAGMLALIVQVSGQRARVACVILSLSLIASAAILRDHAFTKSLGAPLKVALVQGNISQSIKWSEWALPSVIKTYTTLTEPLLGTPLIVWPENAIPTFPDRISPELNAWNHEMKQADSALVLGLPIQNPNTGAYFNATLALGDGKGIYLKRHLVPFGEYVPWGISTMMNFLHIPMSAFSAGPDDPSPLLIHGLPVMVFICYESAYPLDVRELNDAAYLITLSDDSWFGHSLGAYQHQEIEVMRAIETGRSILRATNTGLTSVINEKGEIVKSVPMFTATILQARIQPVSGNTPWLVWGITPLIVFLIGSLGLCLRNRFLNRLFSR